MGNVGWEEPIKQAIKANIEAAKKPEWADGYCPQCAYPLVTKKGKKVCNFCEWESE